MTMKFKTVLAKEPKHILCILFAHVRVVDDDNITDFYII